MPDSPRCVSSPCGARRRYRKIRCSRAVATVTQRRSRRRLPLTTPILRALRADCEAPDDYSYRNAAHDDAVYSMPGAMPPCGVADIDARHAYVVYARKSRHFDMRANTSSRLPTEGMGHMSGLVTLGRNTAPHLAHWKECGWHSILLPLPDRRDITSAVRAAVPAR